MRRRSIVVPLSILCTLATMPAAAQTYPVKPIRIIVSSTPGGGADFVARVVAPVITDALGQQVIVENRPGGGSRLGYEVGLRSPPDGYTLNLVTPTYSINPALYALKFDPLADFTPVILVAKGPLIAAVHPSLPVRNIRELVALAKPKAGAVSYGSTGQGTIIHLATALFEQMAAIKMTHIPYKGGANALVDVMAGNIDLIFATPQAGLRQAKAGRVRALGVTTTTRLPAAPEIPTIAESGVPGYEVTNWQALIAPRGLPPAIVERINAPINQALKTKEMDEKLQSDGVSAAGGTPELLYDQIRKEIAMWGKVVKQAGVKIE